MRSEFFERYEDRGSTSSRHGLADEEEGLVPAVVEFRQNDRTAEITPLAAWPYSAGSVVVRTLISATEFCSG